MPVRDPRERPNSWPVQKDSVSHQWVLPFHAFEWIWQWAAYYLGRWAFLEVLEYLGRLSVVVAVIFYFSEAGDRQEQKHYQAWQVINTAQGQGGSGGRIEALQELNADRVPLVGVDVSEAFLQGVKLHNANLLRCNLQACDLRSSDLSRADLTYGNLESANFRGASLRGAILDHADLKDADLVGADLTGADLDYADFHNVDLRDTNLNHIRWTSIRDMEGANVHGVRNAPDGFIAWALAHKAVSLAEPQP
jgi:hypothetical protein